MIKKFDRRNVDKNYTENLMTKMLRYRVGELRKSRREGLKKDQERFKRQSSKTETKKVSPTSRSTVRSFSPKRLDEYRLELLEINKELEREEY